jgi:outer membrane biosynthesis protein TonB
MRYFEHSRALIRCSAMIVALALTVAPGGAWAAFAPPVEDQPAPEPEPTEPIEIEPPEVEQPEPEVEPIEIRPPTDEQPEPTVEPLPAEAQEPDFEPIPQTFREPTPEERVRGRRMRRAGIGLMTAGGVVSAVGLGLTIAYTVIGDRREEAADPVLAEIERAARGAQAGGITLASGIAVIAAGGIVFSLGNRQLGPQPVARLRVSPTLRGVVVSGQF